MQERLMNRFSGFASLAVTLALVSGVARAADPALVVDKDKKTISVACKIAPRKLPDLAEVYPIEVVATLAGDRKTVAKLHETVVTTTVKPSELHAAVESLGVKPGKPAKGEGGVPEGPALKISLELPGVGGVSRKVAIEKLLVDRKTGKSLPALEWRFTGSVMKQPDPNKPDLVYAADLSGTHIAVFPVTDETVFQTNLTMKDEPLIKMETNVKLLPAEGTDVKLIVEIP